MVVLFADVANDQQESAELLFNRMQAITDHILYFGGGFFDRWHNDYPNYSGLDLHRQFVWKSLIF